MQIDKNATSGVFFSFLFLFLILFHFIQIINLYIVEGTLRNLKQTLSKLIYFSLQMLHFLSPSEFYVKMEMAKGKDAKKVFKAVFGNGRLEKKMESLWLQCFKGIC